MKRPALLLVFAAVVLSLSFVQPAHALFKWVDDRGVLHITDYPPPSKEAPAEHTEKAPQPAEAPMVPAAPMTKPAVSAPPAATPATMPTKTAAAVSTLPSMTAKGMTATMPSPSAVAAPAPVPAPVSPMATKPRQVPLSPAGVKAIAGSFLMAGLLLMAAAYIYFSLCTYLIAKKLNVDVAWMSWVPLLQVWPFISSAGKPCWWVLLFFIPLVGLIVYIYLWMLICENLGRNKWLGLIMLVPVVNMVLPGVLAFSKQE